MIAVCGYFFMPIVIIQLGWLPLISFINNFLMAFSQSIPQSLKPMQHYMKTACEHDNRDVVVAYYCEFACFQ